MSGIAGIYYLNGSEVDTRLLANMTRIMAHRGPDDEGFLVNGTIGLGHRTALDYRFISSGASTNVN